MVLDMVTVEKGKDLIEMYENTRSEGFGDEVKEEY